MVYLRQIAGLYFRDGICARLPGFTSVMVYLRQIAGLYFRDGIFAPDCWALLP